MTVALKGSPTCESVEVRVSSRRMRRATSGGMVRACAWARIGSSMVMARAARKVRRAGIFNGDVLSVSDDGPFGIGVIVGHAMRQVKREGFNFRRVRAFAQWSA